MNARQLKAQQIVATGKSPAGTGVTTFPLSPATAEYKVVLEGLFPSCTCPI